MRLFENIKNRLLFSSILEGEDKETLHNKIGEENRKFLIVWSLVQVLYWGYATVMAFFDPAYHLCRLVYLSACALDLSFLYCALFIAPKHMGMVRPVCVLEQATLLGAGVGIAVCQYDVRTIMLFATSLIMPIMFLSNTVTIMLLALMDILAFSILGSQKLVPEIFSWSLSNLIIFSSMGVVVGHFINKERFERFLFAESVAKLAELRTRYAYYDQMTGLLNRRAYSEKLELLADGMPEHCCVIMIDINGLKAANDNCGHHAGDEMIIGTAACLRKCFPNKEDIYRLGGDEFLVIADEGEEAAEANMKGLQQTCSTWKGHYIQGISVSYGIASSEEYAELNALLKAADQKMYEFKRNYYAATGQERRRR